jgi:hypothetical protein
LYYKPKRRENMAHVVTTTVKKYVVTMTEAEALAIAALGSKVGGLPNTTSRGDFESVAAALREALDIPVRAHPYNDSELAGNVQFFSKITRESFTSLR